MPSLIYDMNDLEEEIFGDQGTLFSCHVVIDDDKSLLHI